MIYVSKLLGPCKKVKSFYQKRTDEERCLRIFLNINKKTKQKTKNININICYYKHLFIWTFFKRDGYGPPFFFFNFTLYPAVLLGHLRSSVSTEFWRHCVLNGGNSRRALHSIARVRIKPATRRIYSRTPVPLRQDWPQGSHPNENVLNKKI